MDTAALRGKPVWVNFTATWCPTCRDELSVMERIERQLRDRLSVVVVDVQEDEATVRGLVESLDLELPVGLDLDGSVAATWGAYVLPVHYWLDEEGVVRAFVYGGADPQQFIDQIRKVLPDATVQL